jgi:hypothetical protein
MNLAAGRLHFSVTSYIDSVVRHNVQSFSYGLRLHIQISVSLTEMLQVRAIQPMVTTRCQSQNILLGRQTKPQIYRLFLTKSSNRSIRSERHLKVILTKSKIYIPQATYLSISYDLIISSGLVGYFL